MAVTPKVGKRGLAFVLPKQKPLPTTPYDMTGLNTNLYTPIGSSMKAGSNQNTWETLPNQVPTKQGLVDPSYQKAFYDRNPNAVLSTDGNWTGLSETGMQAGDVGMSRSSDITTNKLPVLNTEGQRLDASGQWFGADGKPIQLDYNGEIGMGNNSWIDGMSNYEALQGAAGLGGLAMNAYGMFGSGGTMDVNKKNIELMNQQLENNREEMANRKGYRADIARTFGKGL